MVSNQVALMFELEQLRLYQSSLAIVTIAIPIITIYKRRTDWWYGVK